MKLRTLAAVLAATTLVAGPAVAQDTSTEQGKLSYAFGYDYGRSLHELIERGETIDINALVKGVQDAYAKREPSVPAEQLRPAVQAFQQREEQRLQQAKAEYEKMAAENLAKSGQYLTQYRATSGVRTLPGGAIVRVIEAGSGAKPTMSSNVQLEVAGPYPWGQKPQQPQPASLNIRAIFTASSPVTPPSIQSVAEMRTDIGLSSGHALRIALNTSSGKRIRFSSEPPYSSVRLLVIGEMKLASR